MSNLTVCIVVNRKSGKSSGDLDLSWKATQCQNFPKYSHTMLYTNFIIRGQSVLELSCSQTDTEIDRLT